MPSTYVFTFHWNNRRNPIRKKDSVERALILALRRRELYKCTAIEWHEISPTLVSEQAEHYRQLNRDRNLHRTSLY